VLAALPPRILGVPRFVGLVAADTALDLAKLTSGGSDIALEFGSGCLGPSVDFSKCNDLGPTIRGQQAAIQVDTDALGWSSDPNVVLLLAYQPNQDPTAADAARNAIYTRAYAVSQGQPDPGAPAPVLTTPVQNSGTVINTVPSQQASNVRAGPTVPAALPTSQTPLPDQSAPVATAPAAPITPTTPVAPSPVQAMTPTTPVRREGPSGGAMPAKAFPLGLVLGLGVAVGGAAWMLAKR